MKKILNIALFFIIVIILTACGSSNKQADWRNDAELKATIDKALEFSEAQSLLMAKKYEHEEGRLPRTFENGKDVSSSSRWWCSGFYPGVMWYLYENTQDEQVLKYAKMYTDRVEREKYTTDNHDVGFMLYCSFGNGYRLLKDPHYKEVLLTGAKSLSTRYKPNVGLIRSWDHNKAVWQYPVIIDNLMNLELLLWTSNNSDDACFREIALSHADKTMKNHFRPDYSSYHVVSYDTITGEPHLKQTHQGYSDDSAWARGQAWGVYGYTYLYRETKEQRYLNQAMHIADFLVNHSNLPADKIPYWDFNSPEIPNTPRDASAGCLMASALIELSEYVDKERATQYMDVAITEVKALASPAYTAKLGDNGCFIIMHNTGNYPANSEVDVPISYADYYYVEALTRLKKKMNK